MKKVCTGVLLVAMAAGGATAQPLKVKPIALSPTRQTVQAYKLARIPSISVGTDQARGMILAALLVSATRSK
jgi:hypothetical protein